MTRPIPRAILFAVLAFIAWMLASTIAVLVLNGVPRPGSNMAEYQADAAVSAPIVDMMVGAVVMFAFGWLAARPFRGRAAITTAMIFAALYIVLELGSAFVFTGARQIDVAGSALTYGIKVLAALAGGALASRRPAPVVLDQP